MYSTDYRLCKSTCTHRIHSFKKNNILNFGILGSQLVDASHETHIGLEDRIWKDECRSNQFIERKVPFVEDLPIDLELNVNLNGLTGFQSVSLDERA